MRLPELTPARTGRLVLAAAAAGLALRLAIALLYPEFVSGDSFWYLRLARVIAAEGPFGPDVEKFQRPPLYPAFLALFERVLGGGIEVPVRVVQCAFGACGVWFVGDAFRRLLPGRPWCAVGAACLAAADPWSADFAKILYTENLCNPLTAGFVWALVRALPGIRTADVLRIAAFAVPMVHARFDAIGIVAIGVAAAALASRARRPEGGVRGLRWAAAFGLVVALCLPWSAYATARTGKVTFVASTNTVAGVDENRGFVLWTTTWVLPRRQALGILWWLSPLTPPEWVPSEVFATPEEERVVREGMARARAAGRPLPESEAEFARVARDRIRAAPFTYYVVNPLRRSALIWLDPTDSDRPDAIMHTKRSAAGRAFEAATVAWVLVGAAGFLAAWVFLLRPSGPLFLPAALVLGRTYSILTAGLVIGGQHLGERRYMTCVEPFAQGLAVVAAAEVVARLRARRGGPATPPG